MAVYYRPGLRRAALALSGDLGLPMRRVIMDDEAPGGLAVARR
jgi:hypothetical protein